MKKLILICMMFSWVMNFAADKNGIIQKPNADLIGSWQCKTTYYTGNTSCYTETENFYFFSDNSCVKTKNTSQCNNGDVAATSTVQKWILVKNNIVLLDKYGKQQAAYTAKSNVADLLKGEKIMNQSKQLDAKRDTPLTGDELAYTK